MPIERLYTYYCPTYEHITSRNDVHNSQACFCMILSSYLSSGKIQFQSAKMELEQF